MKKMDKKNTKLNEETSGKYLGQSQTRFDFVLFILSPPFWFFFASFLILASCSLSFAGRQKLISNLKNKRPTDLSHFISSHIRLPIQVCRSTIICNAGGRGHASLRRTRVCACSRACVIADCLPCVPCVRRAVYAIYCSTENVWAIWFFGVIQMMIHRFRKNMIRVLWLTLTSTWA